MWCWASIFGMGLLWTGGLIVSGAMARHGYLLILVWCSLLFVGYVVTGMLLSKEWLWAAAVLLVSLSAAFAAGFLSGRPDFYWLPGYWIPGTLLLVGLLGRRNARRPILHRA
jgi:hypothetical protein